MELKHICLFGATKQLSVTWKLCSQSDPKAGLEKLAIESVDHHHHLFFCKEINMHRQAQQ